MKKIIVALVAISSLGYTASSEKENLSVYEADRIDNTGFYLGAGISAMSTRESSVSMDIFNVKEGQDRLGNVALIAGYTVNDYLAVEGRYGFNITDEDKVEMAYQWSILLKPMYKFDDEKDKVNGRNYYSVYGLLGIGGIQLDGTNGVIADVGETGFQWGIGVSYTFRETSRAYRYKDSWSVYADYMQVGRNMDGLYYTGEGEVDADAFTVGMIYHF